MGPLVILLILLLTLIITLRHNAATAFAMMFFPSLLLMFTVRPFPLPGLPDMGSTTAVVYGILFGLAIKGGEPFPVRWGIIDTLVVLLGSATVITALTTESWYTGVSATGDQVLHFVGPYMLARIAFNSAPARRAVLWSCVVCAIVIGFVALIELRVIPMIYGRTLRPLGLYSGHVTMVLHRFGLFRTQTSFSHPIDMGNTCLLLAGLITLLATTTQVGLKNLYVRAAVCASLLGLATSMSFTSYIGAMAAAGTFGTLMVMPYLGRLLPAAMMLAIIGGFTISFSLKNMQTDHDWRPEATLENSLLMRAVIVQRSWPFVEDAGLFGYGATIRKSQLDLDSVDNSYVLFIMRRGWVYLTLFLTLAMVFAVRASRAYAVAYTPQQRLPLTTAVAAIIGTLVAMYTVWFGFAYAALWMVMLGMSVSMLDTLLGVRPVVSAAAARNRAMPPLTPVGSY